eukprot:3773226-Amphidinium_carterae.1
MEPTLPSFVSGRGADLRGLEVQRNCAVSRHVSRYCWQRSAGPSCQSLTPEEFLHEMQLPRKRITQREKVNPRGRKWPENNT